MYGIVNKSMQEMITENFGNAEWIAIKEKCGVEIDYFLSSEPYDDELTYKMIGAASEVLGLSVDHILNSFGEFWILNTGRSKYGGLLKAGGPNFKAFLVNLPLFHNRIMLLYPKLTPPEFKVDVVDDSTYLIHYYSQRQGLHEFVRGLLSGLAKLYECTVEIELVQNRSEGATHEIFKVKC